MPYSHRRPRPTGVPQDDIWSPGDLIELDALVAACVLVAHADGWVTPEERRRTVERLRMSPAVAAFNTYEIVVAFDQLAAHFDHDPDDGERRAEAAVRRFRGPEAAGRRLIEVACAVADADGGFDGAERDTVLRLCRLLGLDPAGSGLIAEAPEAAR